MHRAHLRKRGTDSVMVPAVPYARWNKAKLVDLGVLKTSMHANMLARELDTVAWTGYCSF